MFKKILLTAVGIILSFAIAAGGWLVTSILIDRESYNLLSGTASFLVDIPAIEINQSDEEIDYQITTLNLTNEEMISVLQNWELSDSSRSRPHEPAPGQIDMETAIITGQEGLLFLYEQNILPPEAMVFNNAVAFLSQNISQDEDFLPLRYSYWTVAFGNEYIETHITINALTGQIWGIEIFSRQRAMGEVISQMLLKADSDDIINALSAFVSNLDIYPDDEPAQGILAFWGNNGNYILAIEGHFENTRIYGQSIADGNASAVVNAMGTLAPDGVLYFQRLSIQLKPQPMPSIWLP